MQQELEQALLELGVVSAELQAAQVQAKATADTSRGLEARAAILQSQIKELKGDTDNAPTD